MENLASHISYLIAHRDCVIIPGVGAFVATGRPAAYNAATGRWLPPVRHVTFNSAIRTDDGLLTHSFARRMRVEFEEASKELSVAVSDLSARLHTEGRYDMGNLGALVAEEDRIVYRPAMTSGQRAARIGLHPVAIAMVSAANNTLTAVAGTLETQAPRRRRWTGKMGRIAAAFAAVMIAGASFMAPRMTDAETQMASVIPVSALQAPAPADADTAVCADRDVTRNSRQAATDRKDESRAPGLFRWLKR